MRRIIDTVCGVYGYDRRPFLRERRGPRERAEARQIMCWICRSYGYPFNAIGLAVRRDHSTVMYSARVVEADDRLRSVAADIVKIIDAQEAPAAAAVKVAPPAPPREGATAYKPVDWGAWADRVRVQESRKLHANRW